MKTVNDQNAKLAYIHVVARYEKHISQGYTRRKHLSMPLCASKCERLSLCPKTLYA